MENFKISNKNKSFDTWTPNNYSAMHRRTEALKRSDTTNQEPVESKNSSSRKECVVTLKPRREIVIEELQNEFDKQLDKIALINDFMALHGERKEIRGDLRSLKNKTSTLKSFLADARRRIEIFKTEQLSQTHSLIENMRKQNMAMLKMLEKMDNNADMDQMDSYSSDDRNRAENNASPVAVTPKPQQNRQTFVIASRMNTITPKQHQSPFVLRANPRDIGRLGQQFRIDLNSNDFDKIPKYMKGRDTIDELSSFLDTVIVKCFIDKYTLLHRDRENVQPAQMQRWKMYRTQMEYFPGEMFITEGDISTLLGRMMDKKMQNRIAMLRHLHIIQDVRRGMATCFIWKGKK